MAAQTPPPPPATPSPVYAPKSRGPFSLGGLIDLLVLLAIAIASALTALHFILPKQLVEVTTPAGPLTHLDDPQPTPTPAAPGDAPVQVAPAQ